MALFVEPTGDSEKTWVATMETDEGKSYLDSNGDFSDNETEAKVFDDDLDALKGLRNRNG